MEKPTTTFSAFKTVWIVFSSISLVLLFFWLAGGIYELGHPLHHEQNLLGLKPTRKDILPTILLMILIGLITAPILLSYWKKGEDE